MYPSTSVFSIFGHSSDVNLLPAVAAEFSDFVRCCRKGMGTGLCAMEPYTKASRKARNLTKPTE